MDKTSWFLYFLYRIADENLESFSHIPCKKRAQSKAHGQTIAAMDGPDIVSDVNLSGHVDAQRTTIR